MKRIVVFILIGWFVFYMVVYQTTATQLGLENAWDALNDFMRGLGRLFGGLAR